LNLHNQSKATLNRVFVASLSVPGAKRSFNNEQ
jgi:hypothetical protein